MKDFDYYRKVSVSFPVRKNYTTIHGYANGKCVFSVPSTEFDPKNPPKDYAVVEKSLNEDGFQNDMRSYREEESRLSVEFKQDLFEEFGVSDNPKSEKCYELAWEYGHSSGFHEVYNHFSDFVELIQD